MSTIQSWKISFEINELERFIYDILVGMNFVIWIQEDAMEVCWDRWGCCESDSPNFCEAFGVKYEQEYLVWIILTHHWAQNESIILIHRVRLLDKLQYR